MNVGIVTVYDSSNLGSYLQALGMQEVVKKNGDTPYLIQTRSSFTTLCLYLGYNNAPSVRSVKGFVRFLVKSAFNYKDIKERYKKYKVYKNDWSKFEKIISVTNANKVGLDILLLGSDEIWNSNQPAFQNPFLYGININAERKYGYAISVGNMESSKWKEFPNLISGIKNLDGIFVRDKYTEKVIKQYDIEVSGRICDPTLQVDIRKYMKSLDEVNIPKEDYIAIYSYSVDEHSEKIIRNFARKNNLKTVAVSLPQKWCDEYINCSPLEFGAILSGARYVYTSTFHGTIFSILYHTQFVVNPFSQKVTDVLELLGLTEFIINSDCTEIQFDELIKQDRCYSKVEERILNLRKQSGFLYQSLFNKGI